MKLKFTLTERITLSTILPTQGAYLTLIKARELAEKLALTDEEIKEFGVKSDGKSITWEKDNADKLFEIEVGEIIYEHIKKTLREQSEKNELQMQHVSLYEKFVENK